MLRALSTRRGQSKYERLSDDGEPDAGPLDGKLKKANNFSSSSPVKPPKEGVKSHPLFNLLDARHKKKITAKPEFSRYLEYIKEGGTWDVKFNAPVIGKK